MAECLFCKIVAGQIPSENVYEDKNLLVFKDIRPKARVHLLIIPKQHLDSLLAVAPEHRALLGDMINLVPKIARDCALEDGFRTIINTGNFGGQEVAHLHLHIIGGERLPPF